MPFANLLNRHSHANRPVTQNTEQAPSTSQTQSTAQAQSSISDGKLAAKRNAVLRNLNEIIQHFKGLRKDNQVTDKLEGHYDKVLYKTMIRAEKSRHPNLRLAYVEGGIKSLAKVDFKLVDQVLIRSKPPSDHVITADVRDMGKKQSVVIFESLPDSDYMEYEGDRFQQALPANVKLAVFCMDQQKASHGCRIFSLSNATKLSDMEHAMDKVHKYNMGNNPKNLKKMMGSSDHLRVGKTDIYSLPKEISPKFMKHINARSTLRKLEPDALTQKVNKKGQTLPQRMQEHMVQRPEYSYQGISIVNKTRTYSASIEDKRITYLEHCQDYLKTAPAAEIEELDREFAKLHSKYLMPSQAPLDSDTDSDSDSDY